MNTTMATRLLLRGAATAVVLFSMGTSALTFLEAQDDQTSISLPMEACDEDFMQCLYQLVDVTGDTLPIDRNDPSTWGTFDTWDDYCGALNAEFKNVKCMMCATEAFPNILAQCESDHEGRRLAKDSWTVFNGHKGRRLRTATKPGDLEEAKRQLQTCAFSEATVGYPLVSEAFYAAIVAPLLLPIAPTKPG
eukprot:1166988_1